MASALARWSEAPGLVGLKLYPGTSRSIPTTRGSIPWYEFAARRRLPVMVHQGDTMDANARLKFARPIEVDEVAVRFRDVRFVLCHLGNPWVEEAAEVVYKNENVYADTSGSSAPRPCRTYARITTEARERLEGVLAYIGTPTAPVRLGLAAPLDRLVAQPGRGPANPRGRPAPAPWGATPDDCSACPPPAPLPRARPDCVARNVGSRAHRHIAPGVKPEARRPRRRSMARTLVEALSDRPLLFEPGPTLGPGGVVPGGGGRPGDRDPPRGARSRGRHRYTGTGR